MKENRLRRIEREISSNKKIPERKFDVQTLRIAYQIETGQKVTTEEKKHYRNSLRLGSKFDMTAFNRSMKTLQEEKPQEIPRARITRERTIQEKIAELEARKAQLLKETQRIR